jgi:hypothetical protein
LRRELRSAERFNEAAIRFGSRIVKTPCCKSSASLSRVTRCDQRLDAAFRPAVFRALFFGTFCLLTMCEAEDFRRIVAEDFRRIVIAEFHLSLCIF